MRQLTASASGRHGESIDNHATPCRITSSIISSCHIISSHIISYHISISYLHHIISISYDIYLISRYMLLLMLLPHTYTYTSTHHTQSNTWHNLHFISHVDVKWCFSPWILHTRWSSRPFLRCKRVQQEWAITWPPTGRRSSGHIILHHITSDVMLHMHIPSHHIYII